MTQKIEPLTAGEMARVEKQRAWVRDHYDANARHEYDTPEGKMRVLDAIIRSKWVEPGETWKLQCLGITFGDILVDILGLEWVMVEDEQGRDPALQDVGTTTVIFPLTAISKRIESGETVQLGELLTGFCREIERLRKAKSVH